MATLKQRFGTWKKTRKPLQKAGDVFFWLLLILLIIPGPRKFIATQVNRIVLHIKHPKAEDETNQVQLSDSDYNWILQDWRGELVSMEMFRGSVIFLNFWATWCPPCVAELPEIQKTYDRFGDKVVFMLVTSQTPEEVTPFLEKHGYRLPVYYVKSNPPEKLDTRSIPTTFIISGEGRIVTRKSGAANWDSNATAKIFKNLLR